MQTLPKAPERLFCEIAMLAFWLRLLSLWGCFWLAVSYLGRQRVANKRPLWANHFDCGRFCACRYFRAGSGASFSLWGTLGLSKMRLLLALLAFPSGVCGVNDNTADRPVRPVWQDDWSTWDNAEWRRVAG